MPLLSLIVEIVLNILTGNLFAFIIIPVFVILFDFLIRLFAKSESLVKTFDNFVSSTLMGKASTLFKFICIIPKVLSIISLVVISAFWNYMSYSVEIATIIFLANIIVNIFTIRSCVKLYRYELITFNKTKQNIGNDIKAEKIFKE